MANLEKYSHIQCIRKNSQFSRSLVATMNTICNTYWQLFAFRSVSCTESPWSPGEPSSTEACVSVSAQGRWDVKNCAFKSPFICQAIEGY